MAKQHGKSTYLANRLQDHIYGATASTAPVTLYFARMTTASTPGTPGTEPTVGGYARIAITNNATNFPASSGGSKSNGTLITDAAAATMDQGEAAFWAIFDALTSGNMYHFGRLVGPYKVFTADASTDFITSTSHGYANGDAVEVESEQGTVPAGLSENTKYFVRDQTANTFKLAATAGGAAIDLTTAGTGLMRVAKSYRQMVNTGVTFTVPISALTIVES